MRAPAVAVLVGLFLSAGAATAQDLQYRMRVRVSMPAGAPATPDAESAMYIKGTRIRADNRASGSSTSIIVDADSGRLFVLDHADRTYRVIPSEFKGDTALMRGDTARLRAQGAIPDVKLTGEKKNILGYETVRVVSLQRVASPAAATTPIFMVSEMWVSQDPRLKQAFMGSMAAAQKMMGGAASSIMALLPKEASGVPLASTSLVLQQTGNAAPDPLAILKEANPAGLLMKTEMQPLEVKLTELPDSLFRVPADYRKQN